jgi:hypothetical protein
MLKDNKDAVVASVSMFEGLAGGKGKFTSANGLFDRNERISDVLEWAMAHSTGLGREMIKVELARNERAQPTS